jgi:hypothetical protein
MREHFESVRARDGCKPDTCRIGYADGQRGLFRNRTTTDARTAFAPNSAGNDSGRLHHALLRSWACSTVKQKTNKTSMSLSGAVLSTKNEFISRTSSNSEGQVRAEKRDQFQTQSL